MIEFSCPECGRRMRAKDEAAGKKGKCKECGTVVGIPSPLKDPEPHPKPDLEPEPEPQPEPGEGSQDEDWPSFEREETELPPIPSKPISKKTPTASSAGSPEYKFLLIIGWIYTVLGAIGLAVGIVVLLIGLVGMIAGFASGDEAGAGAGALGMMLSVFSSMGPFLAGLFLLATGQGIFAFRDIARNSWCLQGI